MRPAEAQLHEIADIQTGLTLRGADASRHDPAGTHQLIRIGDLSDDGRLHATEPNLVSLDPATAARFALRPNDVLLAARGTRMTAAIFEGTFPAVVGSQFLVIRPHPEAVLPTYLHWFLNLSYTQENLNTRARGTYVRSLPASSLGELEIPLPPLPRQRAIAELHALRLHEKHLMLTLADRRALLVDRTILHSLQS